MQATEKILLAPVKETNSVSLSHKQQLIEAFQTMNVAAFEELLSEEMIYEGKNKWQFIADLKTEFEQFKMEGNTELLVCGGMCRYCNFGGRGFRFTGNHSQRKRDLIFEAKGNLVVDIFPCKYFQAEGAEPITIPDDFCPW